MASTAIAYRVDLTQRAQHLVRVLMTVPKDLAPGARIVLPTWTPGSYVIRNYTHHVQRIALADGTPLAQDGTSAWRLPADADGPVEIALEIYGFELTVRTNHIDDHHALLIPPATFPFVDGAMDRPHTVTIDVPPGWRAWSMIDAEPRTAGAVEVPDYHRLVDAAFELGDHPEVAFDVRGVPHRFVWAGHAGRPDLDRLAKDTTAICEAAAGLWGELPLEHYTFVCVASERDGGGLEHRNGTVVMFPANDIGEPDAYLRFLAIVSHEYLHLWNVKRLPPRALIDIDYERPVHTPSLWVAEGWTSYYDQLLLVRSGIWTVARYLERVGDDVRGALERPGAALQSARQASHDAWTKFYVRDENWLNSTISYYDHGALLAWCLDLTIRASRGADSAGLDEVVRLLWERFGRNGEGYLEEDVEAAASEVAGTDLSEFFSSHVSGTAPPPLDELLGVVGLAFEVVESGQAVAPDLGVQLVEDDEGVTIAAVLRERPAWQAGVSGGDRLLAIDGTRGGRGELRKVLVTYQPGDTVELTVFRGPRLLTVPVTLGEPRQQRVLRAVSGPTAAQRTAFRTWTGQDLPTS